MKLVLPLPELNLSICSIPKNGGTTLWTWAYYLRCKELPVGNVYHFESLLAGASVQGDSILVIRDPVERFLSGYRNFREIRELDLEFGEFMEEFPNLYQSDQNVEHHFKPQCLYHPGVSPATASHVFSMGQMEELRQFLEQQSGTSLPAIQLQKSGKERVKLEGWHRDLIRSFYRRDYELGFGK